MIVEVVAAEIGEGPGDHPCARIAILVQPVARSFECDMRHAFARQTGEVGVEGHDIGRGEARRNALVGRGHAQRADAGRTLAQHAPDLAGHLGRGGLAVGARHRNDCFGRRREEARGDLGKGAARLFIRDVQGALDPGTRSRDHRDGTRSNGRLDEVLSVDERSLERAEDGPRRNLAVIDRKARHHGAVVIALGPSCGIEKGIQPHSMSLRISGRRSEMSISRLRSGRTSSSGPMRGISLPTMGAAFHAAVRWKELAVVPLGSSSMATTT